MKIVLATQNPGKLKEIKLLASQSHKLPWLDLQLAPKEFNPEETGHTFAENALIKAQVAACLTNQYALADDSGICVDALAGSPGVYSSRYSEGDERKGCLKLIKELENIPSEKCTAFYYCAMTLVGPDGKLLCETDGLWQGYIINQMRGEGGFGYDPIFFLPEYNQTVAEISLDKKNKLSHRAQAWQKIEDYLLKLV